MVIPSRSERPGWETEMDRLAAAILIVIAALVMSGAFPARGFGEPIQIWQAS